MADNQKHAESLGAQEPIKISWVERKNLQNDPGMWPPADFKVKSWIYDTKTGLPVGLMNDAGETWIFSLRSHFKGADSPILTNTPEKGSTEPPNRNRFRLKDQYQIFERPSLPEVWIENREGNTKRLVFEGKELRLNLPDAKSAWEVWKIIQFALITKEACLERKNLSCELQAEGKKGITVDDNGQLLDDPKVLEAKTAFWKKTPEENSLEDLVDNFIRKTFNIDTTVVQRWEIDSALGGLDNQKLQSILGEWKENRHASGSPKTLTAVVLDFVNQIPISATKKAGRK